MEIVNGFACYNCADVDLAKHQINPADGNKGPLAMQAADKAKAEKLGIVDPGDAARQADDANTGKVDAARGVNAPLAAGDRGTQLNILI